MVIVSSMKLFHGDFRIGLKELPLADERTLGTGVYCTSQDTAGIDYALKRAKENKGVPVVYEVQPVEVRFADLRNREVLEPVMDQFAMFLSDRLEMNIDPWYTQEAARNAIEQIKERNFRSGTLKLLIQPLDNLFTGSLEKQGYGGLITTEGGEGPMESHDTWLIFDPAKLKIVSEKTIQKA